MSPSFLPTDPMGFLEVDKSDSEIPRWNKDSPVYQVWCNMKQRCLNPNGDGYKNYGGRGIKVCERWQKSFIDFETDMGPRPTPQHTIERVNNDGNYEPSNCKWATRKEQARNQRERKYQGFSKSGYANVRESYGGWRIDIGFDAEIYYCGEYTTAADAHTAVVNMRKLVKKVSANRSAQAETRGRIDELETVLKWGIFTDPGIGTSYDFWTKDKISERISELTKELERLK